MSRLVRPRSAIFLKELPKNGNKMLPSALKAGYSESYARRNGRNILRTAIKEQARSIIEQTENKNITTSDIKVLMSDIVGMTKEDMFARLRFIALENNKDVATALKVIAPLVREHGVVLNNEEDKVINVPILNLSFGNKETNNDNKPYLEALEGPTTNDKDK